MRAFVQVRKIIYWQSDRKEQMKEIKDRLGEHEENLLDERQHKKNAMKGQE